MVNRDNWKLIKKYLAYVRDVLQHDPQTVDRAWCASSATSARWQMTCRPGARVGQPTQA